MTEHKQALLDEIVESELDMFLHVPNQGGTADCQQKPDTFRLMRWMTHSVHDDQTLPPSYRRHNENQTPWNIFNVKML